MKTPTAEILKVFPSTERRFNGKCRCGQKLSILVHRASVRFTEPVNGARHSTEFVTDDGQIVLDPGSHFRPAVTCPECGASSRLKGVTGKIVASVECSAVCTNAYGGSCDCACGGMNHGAANSI
jgi:hypothetical protein